MISKPSIQELTKELQFLKSEQEKLMALAVYVGMTKGQAQQYEDRQKRIFKLYETLLAQKSTAPQP